MKSIKLLLTVLAISLSGLLAESKAQCAASFAVDSFASPMGSVNFYSTSSASPYSWNTWSFPGAITPTSASGFQFDTITVTYPANGWYTVCMILNDSANSCVDTLCDSVYIAASSPGFSMTASLTATNASCGACNGVITASVSGGTAPYTYTWSTGAFNTSASLYGLCAGTYYVTVNDVLGDTGVAAVTVNSVGSALNASVVTNTDCNGVTASLNITSGSAPFTYSWSNGSTSATAFYPNSGSTGAAVILTDNNGCYYEDSFNLSFVPPFTVSASSTNETCLTCCDGTASLAVSGGPVNQPFSYSWSNGGSTSSLTGLCPGSYTVTVTDTLNGCDVVSSVTIGAYSCPMLSGQITQGADAMVYLIVESSGTLSAVDSMVSDSNGMYYFMNVCPGTYYVKAALLPSHSLYSFYVPTYYVNSSLWGTATAVMVSGNTTGIDINMLAGTNLGGPGFVGGLVSQGANRGEGDPIVGAQVNLLDENDNFLAFTYTDANGEYEFTGLAYGSYKVYVEMINFESFPFVVIVDSENETVENRNFLVEGGVIKPISPAGISDLATMGISMYPNPANDVLTLNGKVSSVEIFNILGEKVMEQANVTTENTNLDVSKLTSGQYIVKVKQGDSSFVVSLIVQ